jgi:hypothetical protein
MSEDFATLEGCKGGKGTSIKARIFETKASVHTVGSKLERLLPYIVLKEEVVTVSVASINKVASTCRSLAGGVFRSFISSLTIRRRLTRVAIKRGKTPWATLLSGGSGIFSSPSSF